MVNVKKPVAKYDDKLLFYRCPSSYYSPYIAELVGHARHIENGLLPYAGGLLEQPAKLIEVYGLLNSMRLSDEITQMRKQNEVAKRKK
jgi:hypothetical protein